MSELFRFEFWYAIRWFPILHKLKKKSCLWLFFASSSYYIVFPYQLMYISLCERYDNVSNMFFFSCVRYQCLSEYTFIWIVMCCAVHNSSSAQKLLSLRFITPIDGTMNGEPIVIHILGKKTRLTVSERAEIPVYSFMWANQPKPAAPCAVYTRIRCGLFTFVKKAKRKHTESQHTTTQYKTHLLFMLFGHLLEHNLLYVWFPCIWYNAFITI